MTHRMTHPDHPGPHGWGFALPRSGEFGDDSASTRTTTGWPGARQEEEVAA